MALPRPRTASSSPPDRAFSDRCAVAAGLARWLSDEGCPSDHVNDLGLGAAPDDEIEAKAREMQAIIWSKDTDFADRARRAPGLQVVWLRGGNTTNASLRARLAPRLPDIAIALDNGESLIEVR